jgi:hypothetical protein
MKEMQVYDAIQTYVVVTGQKWIRIIFGQQILRSKVHAPTIDRIEVYDYGKKEWFEPDAYYYGLFMRSDCELIDPIPELAQAPIKQR